MKTIGAAIVAAALIAGDIIEDMGLMETDSEWAGWSSIGITVFLLVLIFERGSK